MVDPLFFSGPHELQLLVLTFILRDVFHEICIEQTELAESVRGVLVFMTH